MPTVPVLDGKGKKQESLDLRADVFPETVRMPLVHQAVVKELAARRAGTHDTKGRSEAAGAGPRPGRAQCSVARRGDARPRLRLPGDPSRARGVREGGALVAAGGAGMIRDPRMVLLRPLMTEKSMQQKEELNAVTFQVALDANK